MHSIAFVLLPLDVADVRQATKTLLAPYSIDLEVEPYKDYLSDAHLKHWSDKLGTKDWQTIAAEMRLPENGCVDARVDDAGIYEFSTHNQKGRFDYWGPTEIFDETPASSRFEKGLRRCLCAVSQLPKESNPFSVITPDGLWHSAMDCGVRPVYDFTGRAHLNREAEARWRQEVSKLLASHANYLVFALDVHS
jgi:hypothetical protein